MSCRKKCLKVKRVEIKLAKSYILVLKEATSGKDQAFTFSLFYHPDLALEKELSYSPSCPFRSTSLEWISGWNTPAWEGGPQLKKTNKQTNRTFVNKWADMIPLGRPGGIGWRGRWKAGSGWGTHVNPWMIHFNVWQNPLQYCKVISLQLIKKNKIKKKKKEVSGSWSP